ncbi:MAG: low temperature requirement protein A [Verrucomicrobiae bacterium]|nr:low temperature requirement protein A [Verrucomicrobiae bacterium]
MSTSEKNALQYHEPNRHATWLELFFDLIFVVVVSKITHLLGHTHEGHLDEGVWWKFPLMFLPIWWIWVQHTLWANVYDRDNQPHRAATLLVMLQMIVLSTVLTTDWKEAYPLFNLCYFGLRITIAALYLSCRSSHTDHAGFATRRGVGMMIAALISLNSFFFPEPWRYLVLYLGIAIDILLPILQRRESRGPGAHKAHLVERMGLLIIILMGESVISLASGLGGVSWTGQTVTAGLTGAVMIGAAWWIYFDSYHRLEEDHGQPWGGFFLAYPHFFTCLGLSVMANVIYHAIHSDLDLHSYQMMALAGMLAFYLGKQTPYYVKFPFVRINIWVNSGVTLALCGAALFLPGKTAILVGLTVALLVYVAINFLTVIPKVEARLGSEES